jgi:hypothetical protein
MISKVGVSYEYRVVIVSVESGAPVSLARGREADLLTKC